jgi:hypothetical protein
MYNLDYGRCNVLIEKELAEVIGHVSEDYGFADGMLIDTPMCEALLRCINEYCREFLIYDWQLEIGSKRISTLYSGIVTILSPILWTNSFISSITGAEQKADPMYIRAIDKGLDRFDRETFKNNFLYIWGRDFYNLDREIATPDATVAIQAAVEVVEAQEPVVDDIDNAAPQATERGSNVRWVVGDEGVVTNVITVEDGGETEAQEPNTQETVENVVIPRLEPVAAPTPPEKSPLAKRIESMLAMLAALERYSLKSHKLKSYLIEEDVDGIDMGVILTEGTLTIPYPIGVKPGEFAVVSNTYTATYMSGITEVITRHVPGAKVIHITFNSNAFGTSNTYLKNEICVFGRYLKEMCVPTCNFKDQIRSVMDSIEKESKDSDTKKNKILERARLRLGSYYGNFDRVVVDYSSSAVVAVIKKNIICLQLPKNLFVSIVPDPIGAIVDRCLERSCLHGRTANFASWVEQDRDSMENAGRGNASEFSSLYLKKQTRMVEELEKEAAEDKARCDVLWDEFMTLSNKLQPKLMAIKSLKSGSDTDSIVKKSEELFHEILSINAVKYASLEEGYLVVYTNNIFCENPTTKLMHDIGTFLIKIKIETNQFKSEDSVRIFNTKQTVNAFEANMHAPHVFASGTPCHGNAAAALKKAYMDQNFFDMVYIIISFLESVNISDPAGKNIDCWPLALPEDVERCRNGNHPMPYTPIEDVDKEAAILAIPVKLKR